MTKKEENSKTMGMNMAEEAIQKFTGEDETYPVQIWIQEIEDHAEICEWNHIQIYLVARRSLSGTAALWFRSEKTFKTWEELKTAITKEFGDYLDSKQIHELLASRKKLNEESCLQYMFIMRELGKRGKIADYVTIKYIVEGIQDRPINIIMLQGIKTFAGLKEALKTYETFRKRK